MTTLAQDQPRDYYEGKMGVFPVVADEIIYQGAAVGLVDASGHARPLTSADKFVGFAEIKADNDGGVAAAKDVRCFRKSMITLSVSGAVITDIDAPVYATDDNTFVFSPVGGVFVGFVRQFVSAGVVIVEYDVEYEDPYAGKVIDLKSANYTLDIQDNGKIIAVDTDAVVITLPATVVGYKFSIMNVAAFGAALISLSPNAVDLIAGPDTAGTDNKDQQNTKATSKRGDSITVLGDGANGWFIQDRVGTWAEEA